MDGWMDDEIAMRWMDRSMADGWLNWQMDEWMDEMTY